MATTTETWGEGPVKLTEKASVPATGAGALALLHNSSAMERSPEIAVVVPSHDRPVRLRWLLNALEEQTLERSRWEVVVGHDSSEPDTLELLQTHPLALDGTLRHVTLPAGTAPPGANRNAAWRLARAPLIAFTDDDCRPPREWLERALAAASRHPGAIVQGMTVPDPDEESARHAPSYHTQLVRPPTPWAEACNIVYPRDLLDATDGFDETQMTGEDTDLALRAQESGAELVGAPDVLTYHAVVELTLLQELRGLRRWEDLPWLVRRHPRFRQHFPLWIFWKHRHVWFPFAALGLALARRHAAFSALALPWLLHATPRHRSGPRGRIRALLELPRCALRDSVELGVLARGSLRHRTPLL